MNKTILNLREAATFLGIHPDTLRKFAKRQRVPYFRVGRNLRFRVDSLNAWVSRREVPAR